ncbi:uncharacterized protein BBA_05974 [Beauveria bassiana ARSEF 2860]|uniref:Uncharacterized protein n=1 Tax=Beauveria bassiana (strain ARSEF 2860) TaxID=655819 RepID=J4KN73_BEAB2|nr:uncharacterized protein BBA_05974 [Beauveria bassiana ARSEF 2860]EJP65204.1 hypothetical protein BBA_05974 [Beauveria bassiana ARSEF 2860]
MCVLHVITFHGCGCKVPGTFFCEPALEAVNHNYEYAVACAHISLPFAEIERDHACFRSECPKKITFEPWRCCVCGGGPNDTTLCKFKLEELPDFLKDYKDSEGMNACNHNLCMKCPKFRKEQKAAIIGSELARIRNFPLKACYSPPSRILPRLPTRAPTSEV